MSATPFVAAEMPTTQADCEKAGMLWKEKPSKWRGLPQKRILTTLPTEARFVLGLIALGCTVVGLTVIALEWPKRT